MIRIILLGVLSFFVFSCTPKEQKEEWVSIFNDKDLNDWIVKIHHHEVDENFGSTFRVEDGMIKVRYDQYEDFNDQFGHLYYKNPLSHFRLKFEYRFVGELQKGAPDFTMANQDPQVICVHLEPKYSIKAHCMMGIV
jgi:hypothetical protein